MRCFSPPDHFSDIPPPPAMQMETMRRQMLDWLFAHDYQLLVPPLADHLHLLTAGDEMLDLDTFKMTDTLSGRTLGIRADHTPQIARFDAALHSPDAARQPVRRFCYCGPALLTRPRQVWKSRELMQLGAELYGSDSPSGEWEIAHLAGGALAVGGCKNAAADLGHAGLFHVCLEKSPLSDNDREHLRADFAAGDIAMLRQSAARLNLDAALSPLIELAQLHGGMEVIAEGKKILPAAIKLLDDLAFVGEHLAAEGHPVNIRFGEIGGYGYHTGVVFSFHGERGLAARGGRYQRDRRVAVGFSIDLRDMLNPPRTPRAAAPVACPIAPDDADWRRAIEELRRQNTMLRFLHGDEKPAPPYLEKIDGRWQVRNQ